MTDIIFSQETHIGVVTLNRVNALNALTLPMIQSLQTQLSAWQDDTTIHAVVIRSMPGKAFCAGGDVRWLYEMGRTNPAEQMVFFEEEYQLNYFISQFKKPYIALMDGITMGGGVGIALHGSHPIASERFSVAMPETAIGFFPDIGASYLLSRLPDNVGIYLGLTGHRIPAAHALQVGLVRACVPSDKLDALFHALLTADLSMDASLGVAKCLARYHTEPLERLDVAGIASCFGHQTMEAIISALEQGDTTWHRDTLAVLQQKSPLSLKVTLAQLLKANTMTLRACLHMDYCLAQHFMQGHDFYEGIRARLVDKDNAPRWDPADIHAISEGVVAAYFEG